MPYLPDPRVLSVVQHPSESTRQALWDEVDPAVFPRRTLRFRNQRAAATVGLDSLSPADWERHFARFEPLPQNLPRPLALRYHGHQFRHYNPQLGDGRGFLYGQLRDGQGRLLDLGTKGSGTTPWSRGGDGRLTLKGGVREVLATEMLEALGVNTSKTFSLFETGEALYRGDEPSPTRSSVLVRLSHSHVRIGTFQRLAAVGDLDGMRAMVAYASTELFRGLDGSPGAFLRAVVAGTARTTAAWMAAGFCHAVLNTDNINVTGESFDYGPWRFLPTLDPNFTAAYFDHSGLYAYGRQPQAVFWNLQQLALALSPLDSDLQPALADFGTLYFEALRGQFLRRLGLASAGEAADTVLVHALVDWLATTQIGFDQAFFDLYGGAAGEARRARSPAREAYSCGSGGPFTDLAAVLDAFSPAHPERLASAYFDREQPVSMVIGQVEAVWDAIDLKDDWGPLQKLVGEIRVLGEVLGDDGSGLGGG